MKSEGRRYVMRETSPHVDVARVVHLGHSQAVESPVIVAAEEVSAAVVPPDHHCVDMSGVHPEVR